MKLFGRFYDTLFPFKNHDIINLRSSSFSAVLPSFLSSSLYCSYVTASRSRSSRSRSASSRAC
ncbi:hypothetical protein EVA_15615 [gut metagenome]|uniref:Uncharacterized protein n=1 Tax=gut metagenome TaxID=749906 RepID=J9GA05_9ZZZZ